MTWLCVCCPETKLSYNPATKTCTASCFGGHVCSSGSCSVYSGGVFGPLPATKPNGECTFKVNGATRYTVSIPNGSGANTLDLEYCFIGNQVCGMCRVIAQAGRFLC